MQRRPPRPQRRVARRAASGCRDVGPSPCLVEARDARSPSASPGMALRRSSWSGPPPHVKRAARDRTTSLHRGRRGLSSMQTMPTLDEQITEMRRWFDSPRFAGIKRLLHGARGRRAARHASATITRSRAMRPPPSTRGSASSSTTRKCITTFGPYSPGQAVAMKRAGIEGIYVGGWATSAKGSADEDPGPDLASYPLVARARRGGARSSARCSPPTGTSSTRAPA